MQLEKTAEKKSQNLHFSKWFLRLWKKKSFKKSIKNTANKVCFSSAGDSLWTNLINSVRNVDLQGFHGITDGFKSLNYNW